MIKSVSSIKAALTSIGIPASEQDAAVAYILANPINGFSSWQVWYADGSIFNSLATSFDQLPAQGVIVFVSYTGTFFEDETPYRNIVYGNDFYTFDPIKGVQGGDGPPPKGAIVGDLVDDATFDQIVNQALDADKPPTKVISPPPPENPTVGGA